MKAPKTAAILIIGDEILSGRTQDTNVAFIAQRLGEKGITVREARIVLDVTQTIVAAVHGLRAYDYVFTTGGIGPTHDDRTAEAIAQAFDVKLERNADAWTRLVAHYGSEKAINDARARMAMIPVGAKLLDNPVSSAPGFQIGNVYVLAGVPKIMQGMLDSLLPGLEGGAIIHSRSVSAELPESLLAAGIQDLETDTLSVGSYPRFQPGMPPMTTIVARGADPQAVEHTINKVAELMVTLGATPKFN